MAATGNSEIAVESCFESLRDYCKRNGKLKGFVATEELGVKPSFMTELLYPHIYRPVVSVDLAVKIAQLLNQPVEFVVAMYARGRKASDAPAVEASTISVGS